MEEDIELQAELNELATELKEHEFYSVVKNCYGAVRSTGGRYLVTTDEFGIYFPCYAKNPFYTEDELDIV